MCVSVVFYYLEYIQNYNKNRRVNHPLPLPFALTSKSSPRRSYCRVSSGLVSEISVHGDPCTSSLSTSRLILHRLPTVRSVYVFYFRKPDKKTRAVPAFSHYFLFCVLPSNLCVRCFFSVLSPPHCTAQQPFFSLVRSVCVRAVSFLTGDGRVTSFPAKILKAGRGGVDDGEGKNALNNTFLSGHVLLRESKRVSGPQASYSRRM